MPPKHIPTEPIFNVDTAWLHMDCPTNSVMITGLFLFERPLDPKRVREIVEKRFLHFPRFMQRVREPLLPLRSPRWEPDPCFDLDAHFHRIALPTPGGEAMLFEVIEQLMRIPFHPDRPLWQMHLIENVGEGCALVTRLSHAVADGVALMAVLDCITDLEPDAPDPEFEPHTPTGLVTRMFKSAFHTANTAMKISDRAFRETVETIQDPARLLDAAELGLDGVRSFGKLVFSLPDPRTPLKGRCTTAKRAVASQPIKLTDIKAVGKTLGATVNDVILAAISGGFYRYLVSLEEPTEGVEVRAFVPVYLKPGDPDPRFGNAFGLTLLPLPVGVEDPVDRLREVHTRMDAIKNSTEAAVAYGILYGMGYTPRLVNRTIANIFGMKASAVMTNVIGPKEVRYFAGEPVKRFLFWVPQPSGLAVGISIISYAGEVLVGLMTDACVIPNPEDIMEGFHAEFQELQRRAKRRRKVKLPADLASQSTAKG